MLPATYLWTQTATAGDINLWKERSGCDYDDDNDVNKTIDENERKQIQNGNVFKGRERIKCLAESAESEHGDDGIRMLQDTALKQQQREDLEKELEKDLDPSR